MKEQLENGFLRAILQLLMAAGERMARESDFSSASYHHSYNLLLEAASMLQRPRGEISHSDFNTQSHGNLL